MSLTATVRRVSSPHYDPSQEHTRMDPQGGGNPYQTPNPYGPTQYPPMAPNYPPSTPPGYPPYPQSPYGQQTYGQPYGYPVAGPIAQTNTMAILSLVMAFVFAPLGIVFGHIGKKQIRLSGEQGDGLATAGLIISYVFTSLYVVGCALVVLGVIFGTASSSSG